MRKALIGLWLLLVSVVGVQTEVKACSWQSSGLQYAPWSMYCSYAEACGGSRLCESGSCNSWSGCVGWWQMCIYGSLCGLFSSCRNSSGCA